MRNQMNGAPRVFRYAFTLVKNTNPLLSDYESWVFSKIEKYKHIRIEYHYEQTYRLHIHGMIESSKSLHSRMFWPGEGWKLDMEPCRSVQAWTAYMTKDVRKEDALIRRLKDEETGALYDALGDQLYREIDFNEPCVIELPNKPTPSDNSSDDSQARRVSRKLKRIRIV